MLKTCFKDYENLRLELIATKVRNEIIKSIYGASSGHTGGSLSVADILTTLYFGRIKKKGDSLENILRYNPQKPRWELRDRVVLSKGHAAPALYAVLAEAGFFSKDILQTLRQVNSKLQGHPDMNKTVGVDFSTGSLGQGLSAAAGMAWNAKISNLDYKVYAVLGDGEIQEGMIWEAFMSIPNKKLNNVCAIIDRNGLQIDGKVDDINGIKNLKKILKNFGWKVEEVDGHNYKELINSLNNFKKAKKPTAIITNTIKGKGVEEIENDPAYHGIPLKEEQYKKASEKFQQKISELNNKVGSYETKPQTKKENFVKSNEVSLQEIIKSNPIKSYDKPTATRKAYGNALARLGSYEPIIVLNSDLSGSCQTTKFVKDNPKRNVNLGVQECNMLGWAAGLASCNKIPITNTFAIFASGRAWEIIYQSIAHTNLNVKIVGSHGGLLTGEDGATHQAISDIAIMRAIPNMTVIEPSDGVQTEKLFEKILQHKGPVYFRLGRNATPLIYTEKNSFNLKINMPESFEIGKAYTLKDGKDLTIIASGSMTGEALKIAEVSKYDINVVDVPTLKPLDEETIVQAVKKTKRVMVIQDHYKIGGLSSAVAEALTKYGVEADFDCIALEGFGESGKSKDLAEKYCLAAERILFHKKV